MAYGNTNIGHKTHPNRVLSAKTDERGVTFFLLGFADFERVFIELSYGKILHIPHSLHHRIVEQY